MSELVEFDRIHVHHDLTGRAPKTSWIEGRHGIVEADANGDQQVAILNGEIRRTQSDHPGLPTLRG